MVYDICVVYVFVSGVYGNGVCVCMYMYLSACGVCVVWNMMCVYVLCMWW